MAKRARIQEYTVIVMKDSNRSYWVQVPVLSGCFTTGRTVDEALRNAKDAIESHIEALQEDGQEIPLESTALVGRVEIAL